jgi:hypothetical protein
MTTGVVAIRAATPYREMAAMVREHRVSGFPVRLSYPESGRSSLRPGGRDLDPGISGRNALAGPASARS